eukprot:gene10168-328_t
MFAVYTADLGEHVSCKVARYADDITLITSHKEPATAQARMDKALSELA